MSIFDKVFGEKQPEQKPTRAKRAKEARKVKPTAEFRRLEEPETHDIPVGDTVTLALPEPDAASVPEPIESEGAGMYDVELEAGAFQ